MTTTRPVTLTPLITFLANRPQMAFLRSTKKFRAFVGGFGSGKTFVGAARTCGNAWQFPKMPQAYYAPTYKHIKDIYYPTIDKVAHKMGLSIKIKIAVSEVEIYNGAQFRTIVKCRSLEDPDSIMGYGVGHSHLDEADRVKPNKMAWAFNNIIARLRFVTDKYVAPNTLDVTSTPEGYGWVYNQFKKNKNPQAELVTASTYENEINLPPDYIQSLIDMYPKYLIDAYLHGKFTNLHSDTVYRNYNRNVHESKEVVLPGEPLYIGQDFNVGKMASCIFVKRPNGIHAVDQLTGVFDTPALIKTLQSRYPNREIYIYPDASGDSRKTVDASKSDITLIKQAGFRVRVDNNNPAVKDRVLSVNIALEKGNLWVNTSKCKDVAECLEKQAYDKNGEPDKSAGFDHMNDALGYVVAKEYPIRGRPSFI